MKYFVIVVLVLCGIVAAAAISVNYAADKYDYTCSLSIVDAQKNIACARACTSDEKALTLAFARCKYNICGHKIIYNDSISLENLCFEFGMTFVSETEGTEPETRIF